MTLKEWKTKYKVKTEQLSNNQWRITIDGNATLCIVPDANEAEMLRTWATRPKNQVLSTFMGKEALKALETEVELDA